MQAFVPAARRSVAGEFCSGCLRRLNGQSTSTLRPGLQASPRDVRRSLHVSRKLHEQQEQQAQPLGDYYESLLSPSVPSHPAPSKLPTFVQSGDLTKEQKAARLFGTIEGSGYEHHTSPDATWKTINGVAVPPRPAEPDNCCMSGCVHCVWDDYRDVIEQWAGRVKEARAKGHRDDHMRPKAYMNRPEVHASSSSMDDDGGGSEALWDTPSVPGTSDTSEELFQGIPVGITEFMKTEKRIRERKKARRRS